MIILMIFFVFSLQEKQIEPGDLLLTRANAIMEVLANVDCQTLGKIKEVNQLNIQINAYLSTKYNKEKK